MTHPITTHLNQLANWGWSEDQYDAFQMRRVRTLAVTGFICLCFTGFFFYRSWVWNISLRMYSLPIAALLAICGLFALRNLKTSSGIALSAHFISASIFCAGLGSLISAGGVGSANQAWLMLASLLAGVTIGLRGLLIWGGAAIVVLLCVGELQLHGLMLINQTPPGFQRIEALTQAVGLIVGLMSLMWTFISQMQKSELDLKQQNIYLQHQIAEREAAEQEARKAEQLKTDFLRNMSHELRTPLNSILGFSQRLERNLSKRLEERELMGFQHIAENSNLLLALLEDVFDLASIDSGDLVLAPGSVEVAEILKAVQRQLSGFANAYDIEIKVQEGCQIVLEVDARRIQQAITNIVRHRLGSLDSGVIELSASEIENDQVAIEIADPGERLSELQRKQLFQREINLLRENDRNTGSNSVSMALASELVKLHGGKIDVYDSSKGNHFRIVLSK